MYFSDNCGVTEDGNLELNCTPWGSWRACPPGLISCSVPSIEHRFVSAAQSTCQLPSTQTHEAPLTREFTIYSGASGHRPLRCSAARPHVSATDTRHAFSGQVSRNASSRWLVLAGLGGAGGVPGPLSLILHRPQFSLCLFAAKIPSYLG